MKKSFIAYILVFISGSLIAQIDSLTRSFNKIDLLPAISYAPETKLTLGVIGYYYFDLSTTSITTNLSNASFVAAYTLANQIVVESYWDMFFNDNAWRSRGEMIYNRYPDRNYGLGNKTELLIADTEDDKTDTLNYLRFNSDRIKFAPVILKQLRQNTFLGLQVNLDYLYRYRTIADSYTVLQGSEALTDLPVEALNVGLGINFLFDSRDNRLNPLKGSYFELSNYFYSGLLGSEYDITSLQLDARYYINTTRNHTLAFRVVAGFRFSDDPIPLRMLSRVGGYRFIRGYFLGTYQDRHIMTFESEYRLPFWKKDAPPAGWKFWKQLGVVIFVSGAQVMPDHQTFGMDRFNLAAGAGLRILFNKATRLNLRIDYGLGLSKNSNGPGKRQSGLYFFIAEAF